MVVRRRVGRKGQGRARASRRVLISSLHLISLAVLRGGALFQARGVLYGMKLNHRGSRLPIVSEISWTSPGLPISILPFAVGQTKRHILPHPLNTSHDLLRRVSVRNHPQTPPRVSPRGVTPSSRLTWCPPHKGFLSGSEENARGKRPESATCNRIVDDELPRSHALN